MPNMDPRRQQMPVQAPDKRICNYDEVALGYTPEQAAASSLLPVEGMVRVLRPEQPCIMFVDVVEEPMVNDERSRLVSFEHL